MRAGMKRFNGFSISKRELLVSVIIIAVMAIIGIVIGGTIEESVQLKQQEYNLALHIDNDKDMFEYGMKTDIGNAFVYGTLKCLDPVTYDEIGGEYSYIEKVKERYTRHTRTVTKTRTVNGKTQSYTTTETYWTWDRVDSWSRSASKISFLDAEFAYGDIAFPSGTYIETIKESNKIRYKYYGSPTEVSGTLYAKLENNTISNTTFHANMSIAEAHDYYTSDSSLVIFSIIWFVITVLGVFVFIYVDNRWLED
jgi:hypothetical protein